MDVRLSTVLKFFDFICQTLKTKLIANNNNCFRLYIDNFKLNFLKHIFIQMIKGFI